MYVKGTWEPDLITCFTKSNWDNVVSIMTRVQAGQLRNYDLIPGHGKRFFSSPNHPHQLWGPPSYYLNEELTIFSAKVMSEWSYTPLHPICLHTFTLLWKALKTHSKYSLTINFTIECGLYCMPLMSKQLCEYNDDRFETSYLLQRTNSNKKSDKSRLWL